MQSLVKVSLALMMLAAMAVASCKDIVIEPPDFVADEYANRGPARR